MIDLALDGPTQAKCTQERFGGREVEVAGFDGDLDAVASLAESSGNHQRNHPKGVTATTGAGHLAATNGGNEMMAAVSLSAGGSATAKGTVVQDVAADSDDTGVHLFRLGEVRMRE